MSKKNRIEQDSIGKIAVSNEDIWGAQTQRSLKNFKIGNHIMPIEIIRKFFQLKSAAGILLLLAAIAAIIVENSLLSDLYPWDLGGSNAKENANGTIRFAEDIVAR